MVASQASPAAAVPRAPRSPERIAQLARYAFGVPLAWIQTADAVVTASSEEAAAWMPTPCTLRALHEALPDAEEPAVVRGAGQAGPHELGDTVLGFLARAPIRDRTGQCTAVLYLADRQARTLDDAARQHLHTLARLAGTGLTPDAPLPSGAPGPPPVEPVNHGIVVTDPAGRVTWVNDGFTALCGYTLDELKGHSAGQYLQGPRTDPEAVAAIRKHIDAEEGFSAELINYRKSGEPYWVDIQAAPIRNPDRSIAGFIALETDVSERMALEEALRLERELLATTIDTVEALVVIVDASARIVRFNETCRRITGYAHDEVIGQRVTDLLIPDDEQAKVEAALQAHRAGQPQTAFECHWQTASGERRLIDWSNTVLTDRQGAVCYVLSTGIDITERRQLEEEILQVSEEERRRIGQDLHDILSSQLAGTAMMAKSVSQQLQHDRAITAEDLDVIVEQIQKAAQQARALSHSLMPARLKEGTLGDALRRLADNRQELTGLPHTVHVGDDLPRVRGEAEMHLYRIAYEAVNNAAKHADPDHVGLRLARRGGRLVLEVRDDGSGIPPNVDPVDGLGLHMMQYRADVIGADFDVRATEQGGTVVRCAVPFDAAAQDPGDAAASADQDVATA